MVRKIIKFPHDSLRSKCLEITVPLTIMDHIQDLKDTLAATPNGVALASNQILEKGFRVFVVKPGTKLPEVVMNPNWMPAVDSGKIEMKEGCLSVPELVTTIDRFPVVTMTWIEYGEVVTGTFDGLEAQIIQHECEHLDGGLIADHLTHKQRIKLRAEAIRNRKAGK